MGNSVIRLHVGRQDLQRMRFAYSPLAEVTESLYAVHSGLVNPVHREWRRLVAQDLPTIDTPLLRSVVPRHVDGASEVMRDRPEPRDCDAAISG